MYNSNSFYNNKNNNTSSHINFDNNNNVINLVFRDNNRIFMKKIKQSDIPPNFSHMNNLFKLLNEIIYKIVYYDIFAYQSKYQYIKTTKTILNDKLVLNINIESEYFNNEFNLVLNEREYFDCCIFYKNNINENPVTRILINNNNVLMDNLSS